MSSSGRLAPRELALDLSEEGRVVVDVLLVVDVDAKLLLDFVERRIRLPLVSMYRVQFEKCSVFASVCSTLVVPLDAFVPLLPQAARSPKRDRGATEGRALEQLTPCELIGHSSPSVWSTTNVESGLHEISGAPSLRARLAVLDIDADVSCTRLEHVLGGHADVGRLEQAASEAVLLPVTDADLLRSHADRDLAVPPVEHLARHADLGALVEPHPLRAGDGAGEQVRDAQEAGDEGVAVARRARSGCRAARSCPRASSRSGPPSSSPLPGRG